MSGTLVIRPEKIGDLIVSLPAIRALKLSFPDEPLWLFTDSIHAKLVEGHPLIDRVVSARWKLRDRGEHAPWREIRGLLRGQPFSRCAILYDHCPAFNWLAASLGIRRVAQLGFTWPAPLLGHSYVLRKGYTEPVHYAEYYVRVAEKLGAKSRGLDTGIVAPEVEREVIRARFPDFASRKLRLIVHPFFLTAQFNFGFEAYMRLCERLAAEFGEPVYVIGTAKEAERVAAWPSCVRTDLVGTLSLRELRAALSLASLVVAGTSGIIHIAAALGRPVVGLYCACHNHHIVWGPIGPRAICLTPPARLCKRVQPVESGCGAPGFCDVSFGISNDEVIRAAREVMARPEPAAPTGGAA